MTVEVTMIMMMMTTTTTTTTTIAITGNDDDGNNTKIATTILRIVAILRVIVFTCINQFTRHFVNTVVQCT